MSASFPFASSNGKIEFKVEPSSRRESSDDATSAEDETGALRELKEKLCNVPHDEKAALVHVQRIQPDLVDDEHLLRFLRVEDFNVDLALKRLVKYWEERYEVFGPDKFALPMTLNGAMKDSIDVLRMGFHNLLPVLDEAGRAILYHGSSPFRIHPHPPSEHRIRVWWYLMHVALEMPGAVENGAVHLMNASEHGINHFDPKFGRAMSITDRALPIRWIVSHFFNLSPGFPVLFNSLKAILTQQQRESFAIHSGSESMILESLAKCHLPAHCLPTDLGGTVQLTIDEFIERRLRIEEGFKAGTKPDAGNMKSSIDERDYPSHLAGNMVPKKRVPSFESLDPGKPISGDVIVSSSQQTSASTRSSPTDDTMVQVKKPHKNSGNQKQKGGGSKQVPKSAAKANLHPGRRGDPRMTRAVEIKMKDPHLSPLAALISGGFVFPGMDKSGAKMSDILDTDGITVYQRRNQLLRRLRAMKKKTSQND